MKKLLAFVLCLTSCFAMTGCALLGGDHDEHKFKRKWESNSAYHWHECKFSNCKEKGSYELHSYKDGECEKCGRKEQVFGDH